MFPCYAVPITVYTDDVKLTIVHAMNDQQTGTKRNGAAGTRVGTSVVQSDISTGGIHVTVL